MSGHSKWSTIKRKKGAADAARANVFTKIGRELAVAVRNGGPDPENNPKLRDIITKARGANMPNENIMRSIKKASGADSDTVYEKITYEGYGTDGVAVIVETLTDNKNRTASNVRHIFDKCGGSMGSTNCVSYMFKADGVIRIEKKSGEDDDGVMMLALDSGADDFEASDEFYTVITSPNEINNVRNALESAGRVILSCEVEMIPSTTVALSDGAVDKINRMLNMFEDDDDVQNVYHNAELPESEKEDE